MMGLRHCGLVAVAHNSVSDFLMIRGDDHFKRSAGAGATFRGLSARREGAVFSFKAIIGGC